MAIVSLSAGQIKTNDSFEIQWMALQRKLYSVKFAPMVLGRVDGSMTFSAWRTPDYRESPDVEWSSHFEHCNTR